MKTKVYRLPSRAPLPDYSFPWTAECPKCGTIGDFREWAKALFWAVQHAVKAHPKPSAR